MLIIICLKRSLLNLMSEEYLEASVNGQVDRAFAAISSTVATTSCQSICGAGLLHFSSNKQGRLEMSTRSNVLQALYRIVNLDDYDTQISVTKAVCNLLSQEESRTRSLAVGGKSCKLL